MVTVKFMIAQSVHHLVLQYVIGMSRIIGRVCSRKSIVGQKAPDGPHPGFSWILIAISVERSPSTVPQVSDPWLNDFPWLPHLSLEAHRYAHGLCSYGPVRLIGRSGTVLRLCTENRQPWSSCLGWCLPHGCEPWSYCKYLPSYLSACISAHPDPAAMLSFPGELPRRSGYTANIRFPDCLLLWHQPSWKGDASEAPLPDTGNSAQKVQYFSLEGYFTFTSLQCRLLLHSLVEVPDCAEHGHPGPPGIVICRPKISTVLLASHCPFQPLQSLIDQVLVI